MSFIKDIIKRNRHLYRAAKNTKVLLHNIKWRIINKTRDIILCMLPVKKNKIVFSNFFGNSYGDNPKYICDEIIRRKLNYELVWILKNVNEPVPAGVKVVAYDSFKSKMELSSAKFWVFNIRNYPHPKKKRNQVYLQTWHGGLNFKLVEGQASNLSEYYIRCAQEDGQLCDAIISGSSTVSQIMKKHFWLGRHVELLEIGTPKNDNLFNDGYKTAKAQEVRNQFKIPEETAIILYMPTFRDHLGIDCYNLDYENVIHTFEEKYKKNYVMLVRFHPNMKYRNYQLPKSERIIDATDYPDGNDLMYAADDLISDYSEVITSFAVLKKRVSVYAPDYDEYSKTRGLDETYRDLPVKKALTNQELINSITDRDDDSQKSLWDEFFSHHILFDDGHASEKAVDWIIRKT